MKDVLYAGAIATTFGYPEGNSEVELINGVSVVLHAMPTLEHVWQLQPIPSMRRPREVRGTISTAAATWGQRVEVLFDVPFSADVLDAVRKAWPGVTWAIGKPRSIMGSALYGFVGKRLIAVVAQMLDTDAKGAA